MLFLIPLFHYIRVVLDERGIHILNWSVAGDDGFSSSRRSITSIDCAPVNWVTWVMGTFLQFGIMGAASARGRNAKVIS
jgi:hypothetical protein